MQLFYRGYHMRVRPHANPRAGYFMLSSIGYVQSYHREGDTGKDVHCCLVHGDVFICLCLL